MENSHDLYRTVKSPFTWHTFKMPAIATTRVAHANHPNTVT